MDSSPQQTQIARFLDAWFAVRQFIQASNFNRFQSAGLSATQFMTLNLLPPNRERLAIGELARRMNLKPSTVAKTVDSLESRNMVERHRGPSDKRQVFVAITETGIAFQNSAHGHFERQIAALFNAMLPEERSGLVSGLESLVRAAANVGGSPREITPHAPAGAAPVERNTPGFHRP